jgi:hypothetical protein
VSAGESGMRHSIHNGKLLFLETAPYWRHTVYKSREHPVILYFETNGKIVLENFNALLRA